MVHHSKVLPITAAIIALSLLAATLLYLSIAAPPAVEHEPLFGWLKRFEGEQVTVYAPDWYEPTIRLYNLTHVLDLSFLLIREMTNTDLPKGWMPQYGYPTYFGNHSKQLIVYDEEIEPQIAHWGNPIRVGRDWWKPHGPPWFAFLHEMGHNLQTSKSYFNLLLGRGEELAPLVEGFANIAYVYAGERIIVLSGETTQSLGFKHFIQDYEERRKQFKIAREGYTREAGQRLSSESLTGLLIWLGERYGFGIFMEFFKIFKELDGAPTHALRDSTDLKKVNSFVVASLSHAARKDLAGLLEQHKIILDIDFYNQALRELKTLMAKVT